MPRHLAERADDGFLWWDWVHLTSYGQELFAEFLVDELERLEVVQLDSSTAEFSEPSATVEPAAR
jgi:hypothetical protein